MLTQIPTHLIAGPLGAGKTSLIRNLLAQKPASERWAVLVNEFGQIGLDAALVTTDAEGVGISEVAGGCLCCVNGLPFQVGLTRLLRQARPQRLFIEPSGLGHPAQLLRQLGQAPWTQVLRVQPSVLVLDAAALARGAALPDSQQQALDAAGLLVLNKSAALDAMARAALASRLPPRPLYWTDQGALPLALLPGMDCHASAVADDAALPAVAAALPGVWLDPRQPVCQVQAAADGWSIGWRWHPSQRFDMARLQAWLQGWQWRRAKLVMHGESGWLSGNALQGEPMQLQPSEWRKDSRLELIFAAPQSQAALQQTLEACRIG